MTERPESMPRPISILIAALGGQGGGVLTDWIVGAATHAGFPVQATSIPGVAQRTGATTYYLEIFPEARPAGAPEPVFSLYPTPGDVDVIIASELLEAGRAIELDYASPERTTLVASTHRLYSIGEKTAVGGGVFPRERLEAATGALTRRKVAVDALALARGARSEVNAVLLGALAATEVLPLSDAAFETAIRAGGVAVERNLAGFKAGRDVVVADLAGDRRPPGDDAVRTPWVAVKASRAAALGPLGPAFLAVAARIEAELPEALHATLGEAAARLVDYQDARYAERYLERVRRVLAADPGLRFTEAFARRLAVWLSYEDAIRVADLKTRRERFARIRREHGATPGTPLVITDYLKPDLDELYGLLPAPLGVRVARWAERRWPAGRPTIAQHVRITTVLGFLRVFLLGRLRGLRPRSLRFEREAALIGRWETAVLAAARLDADLARELVELAALVKGYGDVRRRSMRGLERLLDEVVTPAIARDGAAGAGYGRATGLVAEARRLALADEQGLDAALTRGVA
ncbi:MAG: indolepyruvate oxidoreductase subunit beta family protein [Candidatus Rokubacteria bacterium]|nr:indolepyruvate oxidoreductase subunit beta family protein [Candidatus Rokubacteria bacterium]